MATMQQLSASQVSPEVPINENFESLEHQAVYGKRHAVTTGLTWGYYGGRWGGFAITAATLTLTNNATNYIVVLRSTGAASVSTSATNWNDAGLYARVYKLTVAGGVVTATEDHRSGPLGVHGQTPAAAVLTVASAATIAIALGQRVVSVQRNNWHHQHHSHRSQRGDGDADLPRRGDCDGRLKLQDRRQLHQLCRRHADAVLRRDKLV